jgi:acyl-coenzyme A synthetase/AMP-(fatty) acid ligase
VSHQHVYGLLFRLLWPLGTGRPFSALTHEVWETVLAELEPGGVLVTSPAHLTRMAGIDPIGVGRAPALVLSAGAPLPPDAAAAAARILGIAPTEMFGSTEMGVCATRPTVPADQPWRPLPGVRFDVTGDGHLKIRTPAVDADVWHETADVVDLLPDGTFRFRGRADRIVKIEGKRVSLPEIELRLSQLRWVKAAAVTLVGETRPRLAAIVVLAPAGMEKRDELGDFRFGRMLRRELSRTQEPAGLPRLWRFVDDLPQAAMGKQRDADLAALFTAGSGR